MLKAGDTLMLTASPGFLRTWQHHEDFYLVSEVVADAQPRYQKAPVALAALAMMVLLPTFTEVSMTVSSMATAVMLLATQCVTPRAARDAIQWPILLLIGSAFGISHALVDSGVGDAIAQILATAPRPSAPGACSRASTCSRSPSACSSATPPRPPSVFPVAMAAAHSAGLDLRPFAVTVAMAASAAFSTPIGYQTNLLVYGPGGYRYLDFVRVGAPLNVLCFVIAMVLIPWIWPLTLS